MLLDRLSAPEMMLLHKPVGGGDCTSAAHPRPLHPFDQDLRRVLNSVACMGELSAELLGESGSWESLKAVPEGIAQLEQHR